jgi:hypothetical protein
MDGLIEGRIVHYVLTEQDVKAINRRRTGQNISHVDPSWPKGAQAHIGNDVQACEHVPAIVVRVWDRTGPTGTVNLQCLLDGNDQLWVTSTQYSDGKEPRTWHWIEKA